MTDGDDAPVMVGGALLDVADLVGEDPGGSCHRPLRLPAPRLMVAGSGKLAHTESLMVAAMDVFTKLFSAICWRLSTTASTALSFTVTSAPCHGPRQVVHFVRKVVGAFRWSASEILSQRTADYQNWVEAYARNHHTPIEWAGEGRPQGRPRVGPGYAEWRTRTPTASISIFKSMEQGPSFRISVPKYPTQDPHHRILASPTQPLHPLLLLHPR